jgi:hypothetical protein
MPRAVVEHGLRYFGEMAVTSQKKVPVNDFAVEGVAANVAGNSHEGQEIQKTQRYNDQERSINKVGHWLKPLKEIDQGIAPFLASHYSGFDGFFRSSTACPKVPGLTAGGRQPSSTIDRLRIKFHLFYDIGGFCGVADAYVVLHWHSAVGWIGHLFVLLLCYPCNADDEPSRAEAKPILDLLQESF